MNSVMNKCQLGEKRNRDKLTKDNREIKLNKRKHKKQNEKKLEGKKCENNYIHQLQKTKKTTKIQNKKQY